MIGELENKHYAAIGITALLIITVGAVSLNGNNGSQNSINATDWREVELEEVSTGEKYTIAELEKPVLVETFAVWCSICTRQQREMQRLHQQNNVTSVSLNTDPNEDKAKIQQHLDRNGFSWRYSVAPSGMTRMLAKQYGNVILTPPRAPVVLVCEDGTRLLPTGVKPVSKLQEEIERGC